PGAVRLRGRPQHPVCPRTPSPNQRRPDPPRLDGGTAHAGGLDTARGPRMLAPFRQGGVLVDQVCLALPVLPGKTEALRDFMRELEGPRKQAFAASERRIDITKESWYLQSTPQGDLLLAYMESPDIGRALS